MSARGAARGDEDPRRHPRRESDPRTGRDSAATRIQEQARWVDLQIQQAMARGEFDDLPGTGRPLTDLGSSHDRDWWLKKLIEREQITGVLPPALALTTVGAWGVFLVKPQFEVGREHVGKGGLVRDAAVARKAVDAIAAWLAETHGWTVEGVVDSPIAGGDGNREFVLGARR